LTEQYVFIRAAESGTVSGESRAYKAFLIAVGVFGVMALAMGAVGLYTVAMGETGDSPDVDVLGPYACEEFDGDPAVGHDPDYEVERTLLGGTELATFDVNGTADGPRVNATTEGRLLAASARRPDGTNVSTRVVDDENRVVVEPEGTGPFRLWVDSIGDESTITRTRLDICL